MNFRFILTAFISLLAAQHCYGKLAFVAYVDDNWELFTYNKDDNQLQQITHSQIDERDPAWSPDHEMLTYITSDGRVNIVHLPSGSTTQLPSDNPHHRSYSPVFSSNGKYVYYSQVNNGLADESEIMKFNLATSEETPLISQHGIQMWPTASPSDNRLIYANLHCNEACGRFIQELWIASQSGGDARQLLMTNSFSKQPVFSPDGKYVAFSSDCAGNFDIWLVSLEDMQVSQITFDEATDDSPAWSPDGKYIYFISNRTGIPQIWNTEIKTGIIKILQPFTDSKVPCKDIALSLN